MPESNLNKQLDDGKSSAAPHGGKESAPAAGIGAIGAIGGARVGTDAHVDPPAVIHGAAEIAHAATGGLALGATAYVQKAGGKNLRLHDAASLESHVSDSLHPGTQLTLLNGPVERDGYPWWRIRTADGREGWVAGTELVTHPE
ncbi:MAG: SH3 domain-containing protein [Chloroflexales bacterium]